MNEDGTGQGWAGQDTFSGQDIPGGRFFFGGATGIKVSCQPVTRPNMHYRAPNGLWVE